MIEHPVRQVHLDFHTSEHLPDVGKFFDKAQWQEALKLGRVGAINIFGKGHHGWCCYPTKAGKAHPALERDLLGEQIAACHEIGVRCPVYYTVGWSVYDAETHPEWIVRRKDGTPWASDPALEGTPDPQAERQYCSWYYMCPSGDYKALMLAQTEEILRGYEVDGLWYDICGGPVCYCDTCRAGMLAEGLDPENEADALAYNVNKWRSFMEDCNALVFSYYPEATTFYNGTTVMYDDGRHTACHGDFHTLNTHYELEDLPTTWGGYDKLSLRSKVFARTGKQLIAMSGKFHTSWGEFGGFKHPDAIRFEAATHLAHGAASCFGDQLHPGGLMDLGTYANIGEAFRYVEQIEEYCFPATTASNLGLWRSGVEEDDQGVVNILLELHLDYDIVLPDEDLSRFRTIILTGQPCLGEGDVAKLEQYVANGGGLLVLGESALDADRSGFCLDIGATYVGSGSYDIDYTVVSQPLADELVTSPFLNYEAALRSRPDGSAQVLAAIREPYFSRTYGKYCSHMNTPYRLEDAEQPACLQKGRIVWLAHRLGALYHRLGARVHRQLFANALARVYSQPMVQVEMPSYGRVTLTQQPVHRRYMAHLMYAPPVLRGRCQIIEDLVPLYNVPLTVRLPETVRNAYLLPSREPLPMTEVDGATQVTVPVVHGHQMVVFEV